MELDRRTIDRDGGHEDEKRIVEKEMNGEDRQYNGGRVMEEDRRKNVKALTGETVSHYLLAVEERNRNIMFSR